MLPVCRMRIYIEAFGCSLNRGESFEMVEGAVAMGHSMVPATESRMLARLKDLGKLGKPIIVSGCLPAVAPRLVLDRCPGAILIPPGRRDTFLAILPTPKKGSGVGEMEAGSGHGRETGVVGEVPIASGCRGRCTYCIARLARGELRSRPVDEIRERVGALVGRGCREVRLSAQDSGLYGLDMGMDICGLLKSVCALEGDFRVRLGMMNPDTLSILFDPLMAAYEHPRMFRFLHIPVQSGDDDILERMGRGYKAADFWKIAERYHGRFSSGLLETDIIIGFPGEWEGQFERTLEILQKARPDMVNVKAFSPRPGTPAAVYPGRPSREVVRARMRRLNDLRRRISLENNRVLEGRTDRVLITERARGGVLARTADYRPVLIKGSLPLGAFIDVLLKEARPGFMVGEPVSRLAGSLCDCCVKRRGRKETGRPESRLTRSPVSR
jgi:threonylcarbamoyladenosine tRNA methylthiotransferase CDKAL1